MKLPKFLFFIMLLVLIGSCSDTQLPKPKAMLRLEYPEAIDKDFKTSQYELQYNMLAKAKQGKNHSVTLDYPNMNGSIFITYKEVNMNLKDLLRDAQKLSYEHVVKADNITEQPFVNDKNRVFGMYYEIEGDAASQAQFYATDSVSHFVTGSVYFKVKPNYDSIYPAANYLQKDMRSIMESLRWVE